MFARARENARRASCQSNLKQIGLGIVQYTQDYDEKYPYAAGAGTNGSFTSSNTLAADYIMPYLKSTQIWVCPSNTVTNMVGQPRGGAPDQAINNLWLSYPPVCDYTSGGGVPGIGTGWAAFTESSGSGAPTSLSEFTNTAETFLAGDSPGTNASGTYYYGYCIAPNNVFYTPVPSAVHLEGGNWLFADGHVKWMKPEKANSTLNGTTYWYWRRVKP